MSSPDIWLSGFLVVASSISSIILSIQRGVSHTNKQQQQQSENSKEEEYADTIRNPNDPFVDSHRLTRITFSTLILTTLAALDLAHELQLGNHRKTNNVIAIVTHACVFISWFYALVLSFLSRQYRLPSVFGWKLNVHLFMIFSVAFTLAIYRFFQHVILSQPTMSWIHALPYIISTLLTMDLVYVTATVRQGSSFLDNEGRPVCSKNVASLWGKLFFSWATPIYEHISKKKGDFSDEDLPALTPSYRAATIFYTFCTNQNNKESLFYRLVSVNRINLVKQVGLSLFAAGLYYVPAYMMNLVLQFLQDVSDGKVTENITLKSSLLVLGMGASIVTLGLTVGQLWYYASVALQTQIRTMLSVEIYRKSLRRRDLSITSSTDEEQQQQEDTTTTTTTKKEQDDEDSSSTGAIVNLMSTDASRISEFGSLWFTMIAAPVELVVGFVFLYKLIGVSCLLGLLVMVIVLPINHFNAKIFAKTQDRLMEARDKRVSLMNEVLQGIRQIKFFAWETKWEERVMAARKIELDHLGVTYINGVFFSLVWQGAPILVTLVSFYSFTKIQGNQLTAPIAFTVISIFAELRYALNVLPEMFIQGIQAYASLKRIEKFLNEEEIEQPEPEDHTNVTAFKIGFKNATLGWSKNDTNSFILKDISATFPRHELSLISGITGSGKTLMLLGLLGEACVLQGKASCPRVPIADSLVSDFNIINNRSDKIDPDDWILERSLAYVSQTPWLQNASIRDNILFGLPFVAQRYKETLYACALNKDLSILEDGDQTEIGEKGITLSGGQKARVALARAVYSRAGNVIMDDCLSAVDAHTAKHLYTQCLMGPLMKNRTRILVTHHVKLCLRSCAYLIHIKDGRAEFVGSPTELVKTGHLDEVLAEDDNDEEEQEEQEEDEIVDEIEAVANVVSSLSDISPSPQIVKEKKPRALIGEETRATGSIKFSLYKVYFGLVGNGFYWLVMALIVFTARGLEIGESWWIKKWAESYNVDVNSTIIASSASVITAYAQPKFFVLAPSSFSTNSSLYIQEPGYIETFTQQQQHVFGTSGSSSSSTFTSGDDNLNYYLGIYCLITVSNVFVGALRYAFIYWGSLRANRQLYAALLKRVLRAPLRFFDTTPLGRILNRFSKDFESIDSRIPTELMAFIIQWFIILTSMFTISTVIPALIIPIILVVALNIVIGLRYVNSSRELKRLESVSRSPVFSCFTETVSGVSTIRAFGASQQFLQVMVDCIDANMRPFMLTWLCNRWVSVRYSITSAGVNLCAFAVVLANMDRIDVPLAGFGLSFVLMFTDNMFWGVRQYTGVEMAFNSVERVVEFTEIDQEAPAITDIRPPPQWPVKGEIQVKDLEVRYAVELEPVIRGISFDIKAQEKVGVVGRTGSGKSTLALSFFRFVEATSGSITIDSININDLGTEDLRSNLTIIPQDPTLFSGTIRSNMDPFDEFNDSDIYLAFRRVHLITTTNNDDDDDEQVNANVFKNLESQVSEGGKNFSQGQRQLICLARALLKRSRVVLMDEATASVDFETDKAIQETIATEFSDSTILCIAHRLHTVIEYDRILVLDHGRILEYENPLTLLRNTESTFYQMCQKSGEFDSLLELAKQKHNLVDTDF